MRAYVQFCLCVIAGSILLAGCNKEKRFLESLVGNWNIAESEKAYLNTDGTEEVFESLTNAGKLVVSQDPNDPESKTTRIYDFMFIDQNQDTLMGKDSLITDEDNKRMIFKNCLSDTLDNKYNLVWTIEKKKKNKQIWSAYGVDSTFFYPNNNNNPGAATNSLVWRITLERE